MPKRKDKITSKIAWSTPDRITVRGLDLPGEVLGHFGLGEFAFLHLTGRRPTCEEAAMFDAVVITLVEHGLTPSAIASRMTYMGAPESLQAAVAAGICGLGSVFVGSMEGAATMLFEALPRGTEDSVDLTALARKTVKTRRERKTSVPGLGHPLHKLIDPRTPRLLEIARQNGFHGRYVELLELIQKEAERASGKSLPINATGALGAICCEMGFPAHIVRGFGVMARAIGLVGHILEESENPIAFEIWQRVEEEARPAI